MTVKDKYGLKTTLNLNFDEALEKVTAALKEQGFGVLTEIDFQATLKAKLGVEMGRYKVLGACNPPLANQALQAEPEIGLLLPCNVLVYENAAGEVVVSALNPHEMMRLADNPALEPIAVDAEARLQTALNSL